MEAVGLSPQRALLLRARVPYHLAFRGACRVTLAMDSSTRTVRRVALAGCCIWDVAEALRLRRDPELRLGPRLLADVADVAGWSAVADRSYSAVPVLGVPLVTETALRYQWAAAPLVVLHALAVSVTRWLAGKPLQLANLGHQVLAMMFGLGLRRVERTAAQRVRASFEAELSAARATATIAGQYRVASSTYPVRGQPLNPHDVLSGIRLHFPSARAGTSSLHELTWGGRKSALETLAAQRAVQLDTALRAWKADTNRRRSAVADQVLDPALPEGHGLALLSGEQVSHLGRALAALDVRGELSVQVLEAARPGARVVIVVNGIRVVLPPDPPNVALVRADPTPVALLEGGVLWALIEATDAADSVPLPSVLPGVAAFGALALWSRRALRARGEAAYEPMLALSGLAALVQAFAVHAAVRGERDRPDGTQRTPMEVALHAPVVLAGFCWPVLDGRARRWVVVAFAALASIGLALLEPPRWRADLARNAVWLPALFIPSLSYSLGGEREARAARAELHDRQAEAADDAARQGEQSEWERVRAACAEALASLDSVAAAVRPEVEGRLRDLHHLAEERLHAY